MKKSTVIGIVVALGAFIAAAIYLKHDATSQPAETTQAAPPLRAIADSPRSTTSAMSQASPSVPRRVDSKQALSDPRLDVLKVSPDNGLIEFVRGADGKVIKEIDKDPNSLSFDKPTREYLYSDDKVIRLTAYHYLQGQIEVSTTNVAYKPDGSVDHFAQSTSYTAR